MSDDSDDDPWLDEREADAVAERLSRKFGLGEPKWLDGIPGIWSSYHWEGDGSLVSLGLFVDARDGTRASLHASGKHIDALAAMFGVLSGIPESGEEG